MNQFLKILVVLAMANVAQAATEKVEIVNSFRFSPEHIQVRVGDTVQFVNASGGSHTVTANPKLAKDPNNVILPPGAVPFHSGFLSPGKTFSQVFTVPGLYQYICLPHELMGMKGQIEVLAP